MPTNTRHKVQDFKFFGYTYIRETAYGLGMGDFRIKINRTMNDSGSAGNFAIQTEGQWDLERSALLPGCGKVNGMIDTKQQ